MKHISVYSHTYIYVWIEIHSDTVLRCRTFRYENCTVVRQSTQLIQMNTPSVLNGFASVIDATPRGGYRTLIVRATFALAGG